jgi:CDP-glycerol glycerophosphotransferase (TagB/SpsB family)
MATSNFFKTLIYGVVRITPKAQIFVLRGYPSFEDNLVAIYEQLVQRGVHKIVWVIDSLDEAKPIASHPATKFVTRGSWRDYLYSIFSKYLFITHGHFTDRTPPNQVCVNLWHGIPYKVIGSLDGKAGRTDTIVVATSELTQGIFAKSFGVDTSRVAITGQARTDRLFVADPQSLRQRVLPNWPGSVKIFLWLPTFRSTALAGGRNDGKDLGNVFNCSDFSPGEFNRFLTSRNAVCFVKPHPMAKRQVNAQASNLVFIDETWLHKHQLTLYQLAGISDCLISDTSSIIVDYMLLDRPIVLLFEDIHEYEANRGFSFNPIADWLPSPVNLTYESFIADVDAVVQELDLYQEKRNELKNKFFAYSDNQSSTRILDLVLAKDSPL